jgi:putative flippase GtrA
MPSFRNLVEQFKGRKAGTFVQFIKYGIGGAAATAVHYILFYLLATTLLKSLTPNDIAVKWLGLPAAEISDAARTVNAAITNVICFIFSNLTAYLINIAWVFTPGRHKRIVEIGMFYAVSGVSLLIGTSLMSALIQYGGKTTSVAFFANVVSAVTINYAMRKFVIFKK